MLLSINRFKKIHYNPIYLKKSSNILINVTSPTETKISPSFLTSSEEKLNHLDHAQITVNKTINRHAAVVHANLSHAGVSGQRGRSNSTNSGGEHSTSSPIPHSPQHRHHTRNLQQLSKNFQNLPLSTVENNIQSKDGKNIDLSEMTKGINAESFGKMDGQLTDPSSSSDPLNLLDKKEDIGEEDDDIIDVTLEFEYDSSNDTQILLESILCLNQPLKHWATIRVLFGLGTIHLENVKLNIHVNLKTKTFDVSLLEYPIYDIVVFNEIGSKKILQNIPKINDILNYIIKSFIEQSLLAPNKLTLPI